MEPRLLAINDYETEVDQTRFEQLESLGFGGETDVGADDQSYDTDAELGGSDTISDTLIEALLNPLPPAEKESPLNLEADESVDWFATINIFKSTSSFKQNGVVEAGNSRSVPTPYPYYCRIGECEFKTWNFKFSGETPNIVRWQQTKVKSALHATSTTPQIYSPLKSL
jgi:hypothetical protein